MAVTSQFFYLRWYIVSPGMWLGALTGLIINKGMLSIYLSVNIMYQDLLHRDYIFFWRDSFFLTESRFLWGLFVQVLRITLSLIGSELHLSLIDGAVFFFQQIRVHQMSSLCEINSCASLKNDLSFAGIEPRSL